MMRKRKRKYNVNESFFEEVDSKEKAYFLGLMYADGSVSERFLVISLQQKDELILEKLKSIIGYTGKIGTICHNNPKHSNMSVLRIYSRRLVEQLIGLGCTRNKTYTLEYPDIPDEFHSHFIRGVFDGDGCIKKYDKGYYFSITGNVNFLTDINKVILSIIDISSHKISRKNKRNELFGSIQYSTRNDLVKIREFLYRDCDDLYIERKYEMFYEIVEKEEKKCRACGKLHHAFGLCKSCYSYLYFYRNKPRIISRNLDTKEEYAFLNINSAVNKLGIKYASIWANLNGRTQRAFNYTFRYGKVGEFFIVESDKIGIVYDNIN